MNEKLPKIKTDKRTGISYTLMRNRIKEINVRVSEKEKEKLQKKAQRSGLNLSSYLRKSGLKQKVYSIPNKEYLDLYKTICNLKNKVYSLDKNRIEKNLEYIGKELLRIYNQENTRDDVNGGN